jgi:acyl carrier protein
MPAADEIFEFLKGVILNISDIDESEVEPTTPVDELGLESMDFVEVQVNLRKRYGVEVPSSAFADGEVKDLGAFVAYIEGQLTQRRLAG